MKTYNVLTSQLFYVIIISLALFFYSFNSGPSTIFDTYAFPINQTINLDNGLIAYYPFHSISNDVSGNEHNGIVRGDVTVVQDRDNNPDCAYEFNGTDTSYIFIEYHDDFSIAQEEEMSVSLWYKGRLRRFR